MTEARLDPDAVVLDIDGVLLDVADSYRRAIVETIEIAHGETIEQATVQRFKDVGGFNDDWDLTAAAALFVLAKREQPELTLETFIDRISLSGGGLGGAETALAHVLDPDARERVLQEWSPKSLRRVFQALYLGAERYRELEGGEPPVETEGFIEDEPVLVSSETIRTLEERFRVGVLTGRPAAETEIALSRVGLSLPETSRVTMDDPEPGKPEPAGLETLAEELDAECVVFVGDSLDDARTVRAAEETDQGEADQEHEYVAVGVLSGGLDGEAGRQAFEKAGAEVVLDSIEELPTLLAGRAPTLDSTVGGGRC